MKQEIAQALAVDPFFMRCLTTAWTNREFIQNMDRLYGTKIYSHVTASPIEKMVDQATGIIEEDVKTFIELVYDLVYTRIPEEYRRL